MLLVHRPPGDAWGRVASLVNLLEKLEYQKIVLVTGPKEGQYYLPEIFYFGCV